MKKITSSKMICIVFCLFFRSILVEAQLKTSGPYLVSTGEYKFSPSVDSDILNDRETEIWARAFWPKNKIDGKIPDHLPLAIFLHGNHGTCGFGVGPRIDEGSEYTEDGVCPSGSVVTPNHEGYNYIAEQLSSYGYIVVSINANRGITSGYGVSGDSGLNLARGKLVLKHLSLWNIWSQSGNAPTTLENNVQSFVGKVDLSHVGLFGHSRGGEGVRAAYNLYYDFGSSWATLIPQLKFESIFEIGAVDGQTSRVLDAQNVVWNQMIPVCDGDVSDFEGIKPYNRMMQTTALKGSGQKSVYLVYGANHNFFNTEWQESDSSGCSNHKPLWGNGDWQSQKQQEIAKKIVVDFFRANLGTSKVKSLNSALNPMIAVDTVISMITRIERDFTPNPNLGTQMRFDDFTETDVVREVSQDATYNIQSGSHALAATLKLNWKKLTSTDVSFLKLTKETAVDVAGMKTLDFRFSLPAGETLTTPVNLVISLIDHQGVESDPVLLTDYVLKIFNPVYSTLYQTVRIPMNKFNKVDFKQIKTIQFKMAEQLDGSLFFANVRFSAIVSELMFMDHQIYASPLSLYGRRDSFDLTERSFKVKSHDKSMNEIVDVKIISNQDILETKVAITFKSLERFKIKNSLPVLSFAGRSFSISKIKNDHEKSFITFFVTLNDLDYMKSKSHSDDFKIYYRGNSQQEWIIKNTLID